MLLIMIKIVLICSFIVGIENTFQNMFTHFQQMLFGNGVKPKVVWYVFQCDICFTFWCTLCYLTYVYGISIDVMLLACIGGFIAPIMRELLLMIRETVIKIINII